MRQSRTRWLVMVLLLMPGSLVQATQPIIYYDETGRVNQNIRSLAIELTLEISDREGIPIPDTAVRIYRYKQGWRDGVDLGEPVASTSLGPWSEQSPYSFTDLPDDQILILQVVDRNFILHTQEIINRGGQHDRYEISIESIGPKPFQVRVEDLDGQPLEGAIVEFWPETGFEPFSSMRTDASGIVQWNARIPEHAWLWRCDNLRVMVRHGQHADMGLLVANPYQPPDLVVVPMPQGQSIGGRVLDADGQPVRDARVEATRDPVSNEASVCLDRSTRTGPDGRWVIHAVGPGIEDLRLVVTHRDYFGKRFEQQPQAGAGSERSALSMESLVSHSHQVRLQPAAHVRLLILDPQGNPVPGARAIRKDSKRGDPGPLGGAGPDGILYLSHLPLEQQELTVKAGPDWQEKTITVQPQPSDALQTIPVILNPLPQWTLSIHDHLGWPLRDVQAVMILRGAAGRIHAWTISRGGFLVGTTDQQGRLVVPDVPEDGELTIKLMSPAYEQMRFQIKVDSRRIRTLSLPDPDEGTLDLTKLLN